ncbi:quinon protein alcohol dehydrogenase-like superfamily [Suillus clintonianus]|uniref:quinon protein alcohol dehydrogenase-like superfamily n=1 Tax=Suillus clintonianus TaxID=1904413 RepID=UPI001B871E5E|nr:quinon protein alcohol dehydrogenase-like superfamily [Suillus clintonianus]KAG2112871.1 quinon protein alcohol dehydrogenase-like superfamily [Suillus clintonianus]
MASTSTKAAATKSTLKLITTLKGHGEQIRSISYFPDGQRMISGSYDKTARKWDLKAGKEIEEAQSVCEEKIRAVAVSRDGRWIITAGGESGEYDAGELKACEVETGIVKTFEGHTSRIASIDISTDNKLLASGSWDYTAQIWNLETGKLVIPFKNDDWVGAVRFSMDSKKLAIKSIVGKCLEVWDIQTAKLDVRIGTVHGGAGSSYAPVFWTNKNKNILTSFSFTDDPAKTIYVLDASTLKTVGTPFEGHTNLIRCLTLSFDGTIIVSGSDDNTIKLWAFESRQLLASFDVQDPLTLALSPDSRQLAYTTYNDNNIHINNAPPDVLAQVGTSALNKSILGGDVLKSGSTRRPPVVRRRPSIPVIPITQRPPPTINPQQPNFLHLRRIIPFSFRKNTVPAVQNNQTRGPLDFPATLPLPPGRLHTESSPLTPLPGSRTFFNPILRLSDKGKQRAREPKRKPVQVVDVPLGQATYADAVGVDDGVRPYVLFFCLAWFQTKEKKQVPRPVYDDDPEEDEEEENIVNRVAVPHPRVQYEEIELQPMASQPQPRAGPSRLAIGDEHLEAQSP